MSRTTELSPLELLLRIRLAIQEAREELRGYGYEDLMKRIAKLEQDAAEIFREWDAYSHDDVYFQERDK